MALTLAAAVLMLHVHLRFDSAIKSSALSKEAKSEVETIWRPYGVAVIWDDPDNRASMCIDAFVHRHQPLVDDPARPVLGHAVLNSAPGTIGLIRVAYDAIDALVHPQFSPSTDSLHDHTIAIALGRVLAHEIGHVLLGAPAYHDYGGLMRSTFMSNEFTLSDRSRFQLTPRSIERLHARMASLQGDEPPPRCGAPE